MMMGVLKEYFLNSLLSQIKDVILYKIENMELLLELMQLASRNPKDAELGMAVRKLINKKINEGSKDLEGDNTLI